MTVMQVRVPKKMVGDIQKFVKKEHYSSTSDLVRDALRKFLIDREMDSMIGIIPDTGDSVKEIRKIRESITEEDIRKLIKKK